MDSILEPSWEKRFCKVLGVPTEAEKVTSTAFGSDDYHKGGVMTFWISIVIWIVALLVAVFAVVTR